MDNLTRYNHASALGTRHFCSKCGCHVGDLGIDDGNWTISTAIFTEPNIGLWNMWSHCFTDSSADGGFSALFSHIDGQRLEIVNPGDTSDSSKKDASGNIQSSEAGSTSEDLLAQCHCGGVSFNISRPQQEFITSTASEGWLHPSDTSKWLALLDLCDDCRLVDGTNIMAWTFVPVNHISPHISADLIIGSSKSYRSSKDVLRTFCGTCGATVFYSCASRPGIVDVAVGILRAPEGTMAEKWLIWRAGRIGAASDGLKYDAAFSTALIEGMARWGGEHGMPGDFVVP
ncbi:hypothetical protein PENANT_c020G10330 [Penicillium antarcticum]|uniref:CENP-V/GFA domain-containing protein n=1 Tax=Penicillium antarcticum TaxID=416450 RepID=A0A1V6Q0I6_9EURO|nr:uncharacterized protein N7508_004430 [Penicillium antarcticum]KAJ5309051.1 hypothetical protein N7508_004430 [Penicillium antarcticum]OQD82735.1 hypothetical protein PENANT_c020G10330 [Penicillium antarcticum]